MYTLVIYLFYIFIILCTMYAVIKIAIKHAINESKNEIQSIIVNAINQSRDESNGKNDSE